MKLIALDVGEKRIGVAKADTNVKIAVPVGMIPADGQEVTAIVRLCNVQNIDNIIIGMPRNLQGQLTKQSDYVKNFTESLKTSLQATRPNSKDIGLFYQDESLTSVQAEQNLKSRNYDKKSGDVDAEAAAIILQDFLENLSRRISDEQSATNPTSTTTVNEPSVAPSAPADISTEEVNKKDEDIKIPIGDRPVKKLFFLRIIIAFIVIVGLGTLGAILWYNSSISPVVASDQCASLLETNAADPCATVSFTVEEGSGVSAIADSLEEAGLIRNSLAFKIFLAKRMTLSMVLTI